jgi:hypothetical protein
MNSNQCHMKDILIRFLWNLDPYFMGVLNSIFEFKDENYTISQD